MDKKILIIIGILSLLLIGCSARKLEGKIQRLDGKVMRVDGKGGYVVLDSVTQYIKVCYTASNLLREGDFVILIKSRGDLCYDLEKLN